MAAQSGDARAFGVLFDRWFERVFDVAYRIVRDQEVAAEVTQDVFLVAWTHLSGIRRAASFGGWLLRTARNRAINRLERERRSIAVGDEEMAMHFQRDAHEVDPAHALHRSDQADLIWAAADALGERDASLLDLHLRHGLEAPELAEALGVTVDNAHQRLSRLRRRLRTALRGWVLWRGGRPACRELAFGLRSAGVTSFGPAAVTRIERHADQCEACVGRRDRRFASEAMFSAAPLVAVAPWLKAQVAGALETSGVPMQGSSVMDGGDWAITRPSGSGGDGPPAIELAGGARRRRRRWVRRVTVVALVLIVVGTAFLASPLGSDDEPEERTSVVDDRSNVPPPNPPAPPPTTALSTTVPSESPPQTAPSRDDVDPPEISPTVPAPEASPTVPAPLQQSSPPTEPLPG